MADLETLASADGAPFSVEHETVALVPLVEGAVAELAGAMQERGLSVETRLSEVSVSGDPFRMHQVVANLLSNSLKFVPPGGHVRVELGAEGTWARLVVADDGPGIAAEDLPHVFERFFRGKASGVGGSGIGLAVVAGLVRAHGGEVAVASEPGSGTTFTIRLPQGVPEASRVFARRAPASPTGGVARENRGGPRASTVYPAVDGAAARRTPSA